MALDEQNTDRAYLLGRWFAELEAIQRDALGKDVNATIRDRFYGSASSAPQRTFPLLVKNAMHHLTKIRNNGWTKKAREHDECLAAIISGLPPELPRTLQMEDQARFAIGYYHQRASRFTKSTDTEETAQGEEIAS